MPWAALLFKFPFGEVAQAFPEKNYQIKEHSVNEHI